MWYTEFEVVISMAENKPADMSTEFAIQILKFTDGIKGHYSMYNIIVIEGYNALKGGVYKLCDNGYFFMQFIF